MSLSDNFGNPQGFVGRLMLSTMNMGHTPMAKWGFAQFEVPRTAIVVDIGCGGGYNVKRLLNRVRARRAIKEGFIVSSKLGVPEKIDAGDRRCRLRLPLCAQICGHAAGTGEFAKRQARGSAAGRTHGRLTTEMAQQDTIDALMLRCRRVVDLMGNGRL